MSRWRETLCGKVVPVMLSATVVEMTPSSDVLSCGGIFLPTPQRRKKLESTLLFLPKESRELLVMDSDNKSVRYGPDKRMDHDELEVPDGALASFDFKQLK